MYGAYEGEGEFEITYGHSKDQRPDLKQFLVGLTVNKDGLPLFAQLLDGNKSDKAWYPEVMEQMVSAFSIKQLENIIFVADAALPSKNNLKLMEDKKIRFISHLPEVFGMAQELKDLAWEQGTWTEIGTISNKPKAASYRTQSFSGTSTAILTDLLLSILLTWKSGKKTACKENGLKKKRTWKQWLELYKKPFACEADARKEIDLFLTENKKSVYRLSGTVETETVARHPHRGRPKAGETPATETIYHARIHVGDAKTEVMNDLKNRAATFILLTNLLDPQTHPDAALLKEYKEQNSVEEQFRFLKSPFVLGPVFVKKNERVQALGFIFQLVILMAAYLRYRVKKSLEQEGTPLITPQRQKLDHPTVSVILDMLSELTVIRAGQDRGLINRPRAEVLRLIRLVGFHESIYLYPPPETG
ncbi:MAG: IS1634 family transposase [Bacillota bacterium]